jgi:hypothetical protein
MNTIRKVKGNIYFEGDFELRDLTQNWASPIEFPTVLTAYGKGVKSGNWQSCTAINTPQYVIDNYFNGNKDVFVKLSKEEADKFWDICFSLEKLDNKTALTNRDETLRLIAEANSLLYKLDKL